ncbi:acyl-CoA dehydrogenase family protein [Sabulicella glaciei]|uniref:Acyl-CoA dehydrogenase family protein n=1 Tax=Sabulicella glaciei TaxID=2984948 RepID=A0ABT3NSM7_9PROT|nr:acyl-CoA dehydrogenase family protein [Roseococcus sp. MDT2-1-1]MCW8085167.1 acyl-CoA dehydrogenase family protein [Roseococcus sp. MDT2-1-1]
MDFDLNEEQSLLQDSIRRTLTDRYGFEARRGFIAGETGWSREMWAQYAELGLLGLPFSEEDGGFGGGAEEMLILAEQMGRSITLEPWFSTLVLGGGFLRHGADARLRGELVPGIASGETLLAFAQQERQSRYDLHDVQTTAKRDGSGWAITGRKGMVLHGDTADHFVVTARTGGGQRDRQGVGVFLVPKSEASSVKGFRQVDGSRAAEVAFENARASHCLSEDGMDLVDRVVDEAIAALAAEAVGAMDVVHAMTLDYMKTRTQFGRPIGTFQALQHKAADMLVAIEQSRSMAYFAAMASRGENAEERRRDMHAVKVQVGRASRLVGQHSIQLHGGIAMTMEYAAGHYFKRLTVNEATFGDTDHHLRALSDAGGLVQAA